MIDTLREVHDLVASSTSLLLRGQDRFVSWSRARGRLESEQQVMF